MKPHTWTDKGYIPFPQECWLTYDDILNIFDIKTYCEMFVAPKSYDVLNFEMVDKQFRMYMAELRNVRNVNRINKMVKKRRKEVRDFRAYINEKIRDRLRKKEQELKAEREKKEQERLKQLEIKYKDKSWLYMFIDQNIEDITFWEATKKVTPSGVMAEIQVAVHNLPNEIYYVDEKEFDDVMDIWLKLDD